MKMTVLKITLACAALGLSLNISAAPEEGKKFGDWITACETKNETRLCHIRQGVQEKDSGKAALAIAVGYLPGQEGPVAIFTTPLGIALKAGIKFEVMDGESKIVPLDVCFPPGCQAIMPLDKTMLESMQKGDKARVLFANMERKPVAVPVSLTGFSEGLASLK